MQKNALGKGLGSLIGGVVRRSAGTPGAAPAATGDAAAAAMPAHGERVVKVPLDQITSSPLQPRRHFREERLDELMDSIREHGIIQPIVVRRVDGKLEIIAGERRFRASQKLGLDLVPVIEREATDRDVLEMALIENLQREDLNPIEEAEAYVRLARDFGMRQEDIAQRVGKNRATVANSMRLLDLTPDVKILVAQGRLTTGHAKAILALRESEWQQLVADMAVRQSFTVRQTEQQVQRVNEGRTGTGKKGRSAPVLRDVDAAIVRIQHRLREHFATQVSLQHTPKKGRIEIEYYGNDDLDRILERLGLAPE